MAKRKITYEDGTTSIEEIPDSAMIPGLEKLNNALPGPPKKRFPERLDPVPHTTLKDQFGDFLGATIADPLDQLGAGLHDTFTKNNTVDSRLSGIANALKGGGKLALPLSMAGGAIPTTLKGLVQAGLGVGGAVLGDMAGTDIAGRMKAEPGAKELAGAGGAVIGGGLGYKIPDIALSDALALKSGGVMGLLKKIMLGQHGSASTNAATGSKTSAMAGPTRSAEDIAVEKALAKAASDKAYAAANPKPAKPAPPVPSPKGFAGFADPANTASTVTGSPLPTQTQHFPPPATQPVGSLPLSPPPTPQFSPNNTNSLQPVGTGPVPGPFNPNANVSQGTTTQPMSPMAIMERLQASRNAAPGTGIPGPRSPEKPLASPLDARAKASELISSQLSHASPTVGKNLPPISSEEQVAAMLQKLFKSAPDLAVRASTHSKPLAATPPAMRPSTPVAPPTQQEILSYILNSLTGKQ